ncbi:MAG: hypothetical protein R6V01_07425 [Thermoplasmatota archaeon]
MQGKRDRKIIDLKSQDLTSRELLEFRRIVLKGHEDEEHQELISFNSGSTPYNYSSLSDFHKDRESIPEDASYFSYTINLPSINRCSLYLDPDRPGKIVLEGTSNWVEAKAEEIVSHFPQGGERYIVHGRSGIFIIWAIVVIMASVILLVASLIMGPDAVVISSVIFTSSVLGIYLSVVKAKDIQPANTISFLKRRRYWLETFLHILTIALGIISAIFATIIVKSLL